MKSKGENFSSNAQESTENEQETPEASSNDKAAAVADYDYAKADKCMDKVRPIVLDALQVLLWERPSDPVKFLGEYLLENKDKYKPPKEENCA